MKPQAPIIRIALIISFISGFALSGCTALNSFPQAARAGDTVTLAVGSADGMSRANTTATFISDVDSSVHDLTSGIRGIFRLYADKTSSLYSVGSTTDFIFDTSGHEPWATIMAIDLPPTLPAGTGTVNIITTATYPTIGNHINNVPINLEILPGTGKPADLTYEFGLGASLTGDLTLLETLPHAQVIPTFPSSWPNYGAIEMKVHAPTTAGARIRFVMDDMRVASPTGLNTLWTPRDANQDLTLMFTNPRGKLRDSHLRFAIVLLDNGDPAAAFTASPVINSISYYDIDGNLVAGPPVSDYTVELR